MDNTSQAIIDIPKIEGEFPDGTKLTGTGALISGPSLSNLDSFQANFEVENIVATRDGFHASAKHLKGNASKTNKNLSYNSIKINVDQFEWNSEQKLESGSVNMLIYREDLAQIQQKIESFVSFSATKYQSKNKFNKEHSFDLAETEIKYKVDLKNNSHNTLFIIQEIVKTSLEEVLQKYLLEVMSANVKIKEAKTIDFSFSELRYNEVVNREETKHNAELKIEIKNLITKDESQLKLAKLHTKLQVNTITPMVSTLALIKEINDSNYDNFLRNREPIINFFQLQMLDVTHLYGWGEKISISSVDANIVRLLTGDLVRNTAKILIQGIDVSSTEGAFHIDKVSMDHKTSTPQQFYDWAFTLGENPSDKEAIDFLFKLFRQIKFSQAFSIEGVTLEVGDVGKTEIHLKNLSGLTDLRFDEGIGNVEVFVKTGLSKLFNLRSLGYPVGFNDLTLQLKITLDNTAVGVWKEVILKSIDLKQEIQVMNKAVRETIAMQPELIIKLEGGQTNLDVLMANLSIKLDRDTSKSISYEPFFRDPIVGFKKVFYQHGSTNLKIDIKDRKTLSSMIDNTFEKAGFAESFIIENERFFVLGENSVKLNLLISGDEVILNGINTEEIQKMNDILIKN